MTDPVAPLLEADGLAKGFPIPKTIAETLGGSPARMVHAVDGVSLTILPGETVGLIGESGSGKTTFGWLLARLLKPTAGTIRFEGADVTGLTGTELRAWRNRVGVVFQDPVGSLDPRLRVWQIVGEPIRARAEIEHHGSRRAGPGAPGGRATGTPARWSRKALRERVRQLLPHVGLPPDCLDQYPHEFSGGGRQRISLARALAVEPSLVILDEPTSALDVSVQAQILNRLVELQRERRIAYLLITHNVAAVRYVADRVAVMYLGQLVEVGPVRAVLDRPVHPYTKALLAALPTPDPARRRARYRITGDIPTLIDPKPGCRFAPRCPFVIERCRREDPLLRIAPNEPDRTVACHRAEEVGDLPPTVLLEKGPDGPPPAAPT
jgi:oligopeptide/dipeptide ABC transporter ATP-binding protein